MHALIGLIAFLLILSLCACWVSLSSSRAAPGIDRIVQYFIRCLACVFCILISLVLLLVDYGDIVLVIASLAMIAAFMGYVLFTFYSEVIKK